RLVADEDIHFARGGDEGAPRIHGRLVAGQSVVTGLQRFAMLGTALAGPVVEQIIGSLARRAQELIGSRRGRLDGHGYFKPVVFHRRSYAIGAGEARPKVVAPANQAATTAKPLARSP